MKLTGYKQDLNNKKLEYISSLLGVYIKISPTLLITKAGLINMSVNKLAKDRYAFFEGQ